MNAKTGVLTLNTVTGNQTSPSLGFTPTAVLFYACPNETADNTIVVSAKMMVGAATSSSDRWAHSVYDVDGTGSGDCQTRFTSGKCLLDIDAAGAVLWAADFVSMNADDFTINITTAPASAFRVFYLALGGVPAKAGTFTLPAAGASVSVSGLTFTPTAAICAYGAFVVDTAEAHVKWGFGVAASGSGGVTQACYAITARDAIGTSQKAKAAQSAKFLYQVSPTGDTVDAVATVSFERDGFTLAISDNPGTATLVGYLAFAGVRAKVVNDTKAVSVTTKSTSTVGFTPKALLAFSVRSTSADQAAVGASTHNSLGTTTGTGAHGVAYNLSIDGAATEDSSAYTSASNVVNFLSNTIGSSVLARAALSSFDANGFTLNYTSADASADVIYFLALADAVSQPPPRRSMQHLLVR